mgnify:CR=1 FL=1
MRKPIPNYENYHIDSSGYVININTNKILKHDVGRRGYHRVTLSKNGKTERFSIHRLVATAFIPNPHNYETVNHDKSKDHNGVSDLTWMSRQQNQQHAVDNGLCPSGSDNGNSKWNKQQIVEVCEMYARGCKGGEIRRLTGLPKSTIDDIRSRKTWKHISKDFIW